MTKGSILIKPAEVKIIVSPLIKTEEYDGDTKELSEDIHDIISQNLKKFG